MSEKNQFGTKIGLVAATVGSAVGLGNVWRFPAETVSNGGAAFLLLYVACVLVLGVPVMLAEMSLGRAGRSDSVGVFRRLSPRSGWWVVGALGLLSSYMIMCFYMVVEGWTLEYLWQSVTGGLYAPAGEAVAGGSVEAADSLFSMRMEEYISSDLPPLVFTAIVILLNIGILLGGVQKGIERLSNIMLPLLFVVLGILCFVSLTLPGAEGGLKWFLTPDFSKITASTVINALGQTFFSLSLGMGILVTYASYYPADTRLGGTSLTVALMSLLVALMVGCVIFPAVSSFGLADHSLRGATLVFQTLPEVFAYMPGTRIWSTLFFILLMVAALTSTVSIAEVSVAFLRDRFHMRRHWAVITALAPLLVFSSLCSLSMGSLADFKIFGLTIFDFLDNVSTNIILPLVSIGICLYMGWWSPRGLLAAELTNSGAHRSRITALVQFIIRYVAPLLIAVIWIYNFV